MPPPTTTTSKLPSESADRATSRSNMVAGRFIKAPFRQPATFRRHDKSPAAPRCRRSSVLRVSGGRGTPSAGQSFFPRRPFACQGRGVAGRRLEEQLAGLTGHSWVTPGRRPVVDSLVTIIHNRDFGRPPPWRTTRAPLLPTDLLAIRFCRGKSPSAVDRRRKWTWMKASWRQRAACRGVDPDIFYPVSDEDAEEAKAVCASCTVRQACLEYSLAAREREGVWGGLTERERRRIVRQHRKSA
ncbi:MAG: WhiB family transcriptional regulator [Acidimicrobiales bacterium]